ncbi:TetR/AcrR family transcriptional regulator [Henriciella pelagia]|jgi:AcrR family transcriptional regulator|uniref:TetR family transcriptional regulator n=1 Tax=Henriciella pelagia TaxID=1977912 RepID=A0ABQ1JKB2_9PROT|nr:TetR/AcrR family transcriptional regulator [Henriciella pelagia]GGB71179.1 TetR family transcriptional regulator [Henriciella pelagia]
MAAGTRERIVETARQLFNRLHYANVTTAMLAEAVGISEGNLWYHFKTKRDLLEAITGDFLERNAARLAVQPDQADILGSYVAYLGALAGELRQFRFLYRDQADYGAHTEALNEALPDIYAGSRNNFCAFFRAMKDQGALNIDDDEIADLAVNAILVLRYTLEYLRESGQADTEGSGAVARGIRQHLTLFSHRLSPAARLELERRIDALEKGRLKIRDACVMNAQ